MKLRHKIFYESKQLKQYIRAMCGQHWRDIYQDFYFIIDKLNDDLVDDLISRNKLEAYYSRMIFLQAKGENNLLQKFYKNQNVEFDEKFESEVETYDIEKDKEFEAKLKAINEYIDQPKDLKQWYYGKLVTHVVKEGSLRKASIVTDIDHCTINYAITKAREAIKQKIK